jgi:hypothetical protein
VKKVKCLEVDFVASKGEELNRGFLECLIRINFDINERRAALGRNFDATIGKAACEASIGNVEFGYQLSICSSTEENHGKP